MSYFLIALVIMVALSPLISMMPTRRQRLIADLRQAAAIAGLYVELKADPLSKESGYTMAFYGCRRRRDDHPSPGRVLYLNRGGEWVAENEPWPADKLECLAHFPEGVTAVSEDLDGAGVFWDERGDREDVEHISRLLRGLLGREH